jgi:hypothetical protein
VDFVKDIVPLLEEHCLSCHQGDEPKGGFVVTDREAVLGYITPGSLSDSSLWTDYLTAPSKATQEDSLVMPPDGPMPMAQLALMKLWIEEGAPWPADFKFGDQAKTIQRGGSLPVRIYRAIGYFHPAIVHFPIALLSLAGMSVALSFFLGQRLIPFAYACLVIGAIGAVVSAVMGWSFADIRGLAEWSTMITSKATEKESNDGGRCRCGGLDGLPRTQCRREAAWLGMETRHAGACDVSRDCWSPRWRVGVRRYLRQGNRIVFQVSLA